jgi:hypothetical protein
MSVVGGGGTMASVTDDQPAASDVRVFDRMLAAGMSIERIEQHLAAGRVRLDGECVTWGDAHRAGARLADTPRPTWDHSSPRLSRWPTG